MKNKTEAKFSVSGLRGIWRQSLNKKTVQNVAQAFAEFLKARNYTRVLIGRDGRVSGTPILTLLNTTLAAGGIEVTNAGILPTPTILHCTRTNPYDAAIIITASHNPQEYNGLKFVSGDGQFFSQDEIEELQHLMQNSHANARDIPPPQETHPCGTQYINTIVDTCATPAIQASNLHVVLDPVNSAGGPLAETLFDTLGISYTTIHKKISGRFQRPPEPTPKNLTDLSKEVQAQQADLGFAQDPDADRLALVDERGNALSEEYTLALAVEYVLSHHPKSTVVVNMSTSGIIDDIAAKHDSTVIRTKIGEAHVTTGITEHDAIIGGEGNGGVIYPTANLARDSFVGMTLIAALLAEREQSLSELIDTLPSRVMQKEKASFQGDLESVYTALTAAIPHKEKHTIDGLRLNRDDGTWVHIRPSNTEPVVRIIAEANDRQTVNELIGHATSIVSSHNQ